VNRRNIFIKLGFVSPEIATKIDLTARPFYSIGSILSPPLNAKAEGKNLLYIYIYIRQRAKTCYINLLKELYIRQRAKTCYIYIYIYISFFIFLAEIERGKEELGSCTMAGIIRLRFFRHI